MRHFALAALLAIGSLSVSLPVLAEGVDGGTLPDYKRSRLQLYLTPAEAHEIMGREPARTLFLDVRTRAEAMYVGMPTDADALVPYVEHQELMSDWDERRHMYQIMMGLEFKRDVPFRTVYIHGLVRDSQGRKMSKSLGNSIDPVEMIEKYGADALRFTFAAHLYSGKDMKFSEQRLEGYRNFMNKIWNAARFALSNLADFQAPAEGVKALPNKAHISVFDQWIITKLAEVTKEVEEPMDAEKFSDAANALYHFIWNQFCDWYIEFTKRIMNGTNMDEKRATQLVISQVLNRMMRLLHPIAPFISEEIYQKLPIKATACIVDQFP